MASRKLRLPLPVLFFSLLIAVLLGAAIYLQSTGSEGNQPTHTKTQLTNQTIEALPSLSPKTIFSSPQPSFNPIPVNSGLSVSVPILMYHYIGLNPNPKDKVRDNLSIAPDAFDQEMGYLQQSGFTPITLDTLYAGLKKQTVLPPKPIVLTFDDGYIDFYVNAFPILRKYGFHAVSFIPTGLMNQGYYLLWSQIKDMASTGLISFEAHSVSHAYLPTLSPDKITYQVLQSKKVLEAEVGVPVNFFAYPYGATNALAEQTVKNAGFVAALGTWYGVTESEGDQYNWPRVRIGGGTTLDAFKRKF